MELTKEIFDKMRKGKQMIVAAMNMQQKTMGFQVPLIGFGKAYDGPPADNAKYEEAQRQMMETSVSARWSSRRKLEGRRASSGSAAGWHAGPGSTTAAVSCFPYTTMKERRPKLTSLLKAYAEDCLISLTIRTRITAPTVAAMIAARMPPPPCSPRLGATPTRSTRRKRQPECRQADRSLSLHRFG